MIYRHPWYAIFIRFENDVELGASIFMLISSYHVYELDDMAHSEGMVSNSGHVDNIHFTHIASISWKLLKF